MRMNLFIAAFALAVLVISGCVPQPIYQSVKTDRASSVHTSIQSATTGIDSMSSSNSAKAAAGGMAAPAATGLWSKEKQEAMMKEIRSWIGTPYKFGLVEKGKGTDCSGFVGAVFQKVLNVSLPRQSADMYGSGETVLKNELKFGDLVFFQNTYKGAKGASHVGIYVGDDRIAHASTTVGVTISELSEDYYAKHYLGCRRMIKN